MSMQISFVVGQRSRSRGQILAKLTYILRGMEKRFPDHNSRIVSVIVMKLYGIVHLTWVLSPIVFRVCSLMVKVTEVKT